MPARPWLAFALAPLALLPSCSREQGSQDTPSGSAPLADLPPISSAPLEANGGAPGGGPLFERLDADDAGIDFRHAWKPRNSFDELLQKTGFTGGGVALGDYDGDGLPDLFLTRPHTGARLYRNLGGFAFDDVTAAAGIDTGDAWTTGASFADVNNDGHLDLYVCAYESDNRLFVNRGDGTFEDKAPAAGLNFVGANVKMAFADIDNDGDLDAYLVTNRLEPVDNPKIDYLGSPGNYRVAEHHRELVSVIDLPDGTQKFTKAGQFDHLYRNEFAETGELRFTDISKQAGIDGADHGLDATWWDYDADGDADLYVSNDFTDPDKLYRNRGDGTFEDVLADALPHTPWFTMGSAAGDLNNDGLLDLVAADMSATTHYREKVSMGAMDAVAWFLDTAEPRQFMRNAVYLNTGTERFMEIAHMAGLASSNWTWSIKIADLDGDGREDVFATNGFPFDYLNSDFAADLARSGNATNPEAWRNAPVLPEENIAFRNSGDYRFADAGADWGLGELAISFGCGIGDLDGDGDPDMVVNNFDAPPSLYRNRSGGRSNWLAVQLRGRGSNPHGLGALVTLTTAAGKQVRYVNSGGGYMSNDEPGVCTFGIGEENVAKSLEVRWPGGGTQTFHSLEAGHRYTIAETETGTPPPAGEQTRPMFTPSGRFAKFRHRERPYDDFAREPLLPNKLSQLGPPLVAHGDWLYLGGASGQAGQLFHRDGRPIPQPAFEGDATSEDLDAIFFDADGDGDADLYVASGGNEAAPGHPSYQDRLYLNESGTFTKATDALPANTDSSGAVSAADLDGDGDLDLFVGARVVPGAYPTAPPSRILRNDGGRFNASASLDLGMVTDATWADIEGDGDPDLLATTEYGPVFVLTNDGGKLTASEGTHRDLTGWWNGITAGDVDADGDIDFAVTNFGLNTKYHPTPEKPQLIYYADFAGDGDCHIVEAKLSGGSLLPVRGKSCSTAAMPHLGAKFDTFHSFASATLEEIYSAPKLEGGLRREANTLESGILLNDGTGNFAFKPLPRIAQASPAFGATFLDADGDGQPDLFLAQNFFGPQRETGRMAGGLGQLLLGNGDGTFEPVPARHSGIVIPEDATGVLALDLDGDGREDLVIATNDGPVRVFLRHGH